MESKEYPNPNPNKVYNIGCQKVIEIILNLVFVQVIFVKGSNNKKLKKKHVKPIPTVIFNGCSVENCENIIINHQC